MLRELDGFQIRFLQIPVCARSLQCNQNKKQMPFSLQDIELNYAVEFCE